VKNPINWSYLHAGVVIWLDGEPQLLAKRALKDGIEKRPLLLSADVPAGQQLEAATAKIAGLLDERRKYYVNADIHVTLEGYGQDVEAGAPTPVVMYRWAGGGVLAAEGRERLLWLLRLLWPWSWAGCCPAWPGLLWASMSRPCCSRCGAGRPRTCTGRPRPVHQHEPLLLMGLAAVPCCAVPCCRAMQSMLKRIKDTKAEREARMNFTIEYAGGVPSMKMKAAGGSPAVEQQEQQE
jgi:hypothetical protein